MIENKNKSHESSSVESNTIIDNDYSFSDDLDNNKIETQDKTNDKTEILIKKGEENTGSNSYISEIQITKNKQDNDNKNNEEIKEEINSICLNIFLNFSKFYYEEKDFLLSYQTLIKIFKEGNIISSEFSTNSNSKTNSKTAKSFMTNNSNSTVFNKKKNLFTSKNIEILIKELTPKVSKLTSNQFLNLIALIAKKKYPKEFEKNPKETVILFTNQFLRPINAKIENDDTDKYQYKIIESSINKFNHEFLDQGSEILLVHLYEPIHWIYITYFKHELNINDKNIKKLIKTSLESLVNFSKDYEICPSLITIEKIAIYYNCLLDKNLNDIFEEDIGNIFTFNKFCLFLIVFSNNIYKRASEKLWERFSFLIKKISMGKGYQNMSKKLNIKTPTEKQLKIDNRLIDEIIKLEEVESYTRITELKTEEDYDEDDDKQIFKNIYDIYSTIGDKLITSQMTVSSFLKVLRDLGVFNIYKDNKNEELNVIQTSIVNKSHTDYEYTLNTNRKIKKQNFSEKEAQMIFFKVCSNKKFNYDDYNYLFNDDDLDIYNKINFEQFYNIIQEIAYFIHQKKKKRDAFKQFKNVDIKIQNYKNSINNELEEIKYLLNILRTESQDPITRNLKQIFAIIQNILYQIFMMYSVKNVLNFNQFFLIYKDFNIFPNIISLIEMKKLFYCLCKISNEENLSKGNFLEFEYFICSLGLCSKFRREREKNINDCQKLASILYVMRNSKGINNPRHLTIGGKLIAIDKELINILIILNSKFPEYFNGNEKSKKTLSTDNLFNDIFNE